MEIDPYYWRPRWEMMGEQRAGFEHVRAALAEWPDVCLPCMDTGLPCYHRDDRNDHSEVVAFLFRHDGANSEGI